MTETRLVTFMIPSRQLTVLTTAAVELYGRATEALHEEMTHPRPTAEAAATIRESETRRIATVIDMLSAPQPDAVQEIPLTIDPWLLAHLSLSASLEVADSLADGHKQLQAGDHHPMADTVDRLGELFRLGRLARETAEAIGTVDGIRPAATRLLGWFAVETGRSPGTLATAAIMAYIGPGRDRSESRTGTAGSPTGDRS